MSDVLRKYGIPVGIVIAAIVAIYFYGRARYDSGRQDLRTELLLQKPEVKVNKDSSKTIIGEGVGVKVRPAEGNLFDRKWTRLSTQLNIDTVEPEYIAIKSDSCCYNLYPYIVTVHDSLLTGEIICKPDVQKALWRLRPISETRELTKYIPEQYNFWATGLLGFNNNGTSVGLLAGYRAVGVGISYDGSPTYLVALHWTF